MKRLFIIIASIIVLIGVGVGVYVLFFNKPSASLTTVGNPFGDTTSGNADQSQSVGELGDVGKAGTLVAPRLIKITDGPVAEGAIVINHKAVTSVATSTGSTTAGVVTNEKAADSEVRYIERASGNVYSYFVHARTLARISNKTLPGVQEASWLSDGTRAYARFLSNAGTSDEHVTTYALSADGGSGYALEQDLSQALVSGTSTLVTLLSGTTGSIASIARADGTNAKTLFSSVLGSLIVQPTSGSLFAYTKASSGLIGYGFSVNRTTGSFTRILGGLRGLTLLPNPTGTKVLYSYREQGVSHLGLYDTATRETTALPIATLTEKCVWAKNGTSVYCAIPKDMNGNLPDDWYQGARSFSDRLWKIDLATRTASLVVDPNEVGKVSIDAVALSVDANEDVLVFTDKPTGALWVYDL